MTCRVAVQEEVLVATVVFLCSSSNYLFIAQSICVPIVVKRLSSDLFTHLCLHAVQTNSGQNDLLRSCPGRSHSCKSCFSHGSSSMFFVFAKQTSAQTLVYCPRAPKCTMAGCLFFRAAHVPIRPLGVVRDRGRHVPPHLSSLMVPDLLRHWTTGYQWVSYKVAEHSMTRSWKKIPWSR